MNEVITIRKLTERILPDYEALAREDDGSPCYCSFWHQKFTSLEEYDRAKAENPEQLRCCVVERIRAHFHVGIVAYLDGVPCAWVSIGPLTDFYWTWRRVAAVGEAARSVAGIMCLTVAPGFRGQNVQVRVLNALKTYAAEQAWHRIEAYPFSDAAIREHGSALLWPGRPKGYEQAGFRQLGIHWLSSSDAERLIYSLEVT